MSKGKALKVVLPSEDEMADQVLTFGKSIEPSEGRWTYCLSRVSHERSIPSASGLANEFHGEFMHRVTRLLGREPRSCRYRLGHMFLTDFDEVKSIFGDMSVCSLQPWMLGHVYFAAVASHPHVRKIGFTRRLRARLTDIQSATGCELLSTVAVPGTGADENWWHYEMRSHRIAGEWFFDPDSTDRSLPDFLQSVERKAA